MLGIYYTGGKVEKSCKECHNFPHPSNWANPKKHGTEFLRGVKEDRDNGGRGSDKQCLTCHVGIPHGERIILRGKDKKKHHEDISNSDFFKASCYSCHVKTSEDSNERTNLPTYEGCDACHSEPEITFSASDE